MLEKNIIYNCDYKKMIDALENETVDLVLTDIPYRINRDTNFKSIKDFTKKGGDSSYSGMNYKFDDWDEAEVETYVNHCCRVLKSNGVLIIWSSWQMLGLLERIIKKSFDDNVKSFRTGLWIKTNPMPTNCKIKPVNSCEFFLYVAKGPKAVFNLTPYDNKILKGTIKIEEGTATNKKDESCILKELNVQVNDGRFNFNETYERLIYIEPTVVSKTSSHDTKKPQLIFEHLIKTFSNEGNLVFDGLMGSGTTARACINTGRNYIGFERDEQYWKESIEEINRLLLNIV